MKIVCDKAMKDILCSHATDAWNGSCTCCIETNLLMLGQTSARGVSLSKLSHGDANLSKSDKVWAWQHATKTPVWAAKPVGSDTTSLQAPELSFTRRRTSHWATAVRLRSVPCLAIAAAAAALKAAAILDESDDAVPVPNGNVGGAARKMCAQSARVALFSAPLVAHSGQLKHAQTASFQDFQPLTKW